MDGTCPILHREVAKGSSCLPFSEFGFKRETNSQLLPHLHNFFLFLPTSHFNFTSFRSISLITLSPLTPQGSLAFCSIPFSRERKVSGMSAPSLVGRGAHTGRVATMRAHGHWRGMRRDHFGLGPQMQLCAVLVSSQYWAAVVRGLS